MIIRSKKKKKTWKKVVTITVFIAVIIAAYLCGRFMPAEIADKYSREVFPALASGPQRLSSLTDVSLTEIAFLILCGVALPLLIVWIVLLIKKALTRGAGRYLYKSFRNVLAVGMVLLILFETFHGMNYRRTTARAMLGLGNNKLTLEDYCEAFEWAYDGMIKARAELKENEKGVAIMSSDFSDIAEHSSRIVDSFCASYGIAPYKGYARPKSVRLSHYWSWTYIVGMYNPIFGEVNVNTDYLDATELPLNVCHELCHSKGFANETDCNLLGTMACITSDRADFRYCGYFNIYVNLLAVIQYNVKTFGFEYDVHVQDEAMIPVIRDLQAANDYWRSIDKEVKDFEARTGINITKQASAANDKYLQSNGEKEGEKTYQVPQNEYVDFYLMYFSQKGGKNA